jgi:hypothetical protein
MARWPFVLDGRPGLPGEGLRAVRGGAALDFGSGLPAPATLEPGVRFVKN